VYGTARYVPIDENHPLQPQSPYSASKIGADSIAMSYFYSFQLPLTIVRPFNTYGPRQSARAIIPTIISQIAKGEKSIAIGNLEPTRDFTFVQDTCYGFTLLSKCLDAIGETVNIGTGIEVSIKDLALKIGELMGHEIEFSQDIKRFRPKASEVMRLCAKIDKLKQLTSFSPQTNLSEGLLKTIEWHLAHQKSYKPLIYNV
jgi:nucleoside-diphosphate-sugar epimerase